MARELDALALARQYLLAALNNVPVLVRGDPDPNVPEVVVLDLIADTSLPTYGAQMGVSLLQVSIYTQDSTAYKATMSKALRLLDDSRAALLSAGFSYRQARPVPAEGYGYTADFEI